MAYQYPSAGSFSLGGGGDTALLFIHGFTASPSELLPAARLIHELCGCTLSLPLLPGHGSAPRLLNQTNWEQWYAAVEKELGFLMETYPRVFAAGLSMGALLALHAACLVPGLKGAIAINTPVFTHFPVLTAAAPLIKHIKPFCPKGDRPHLRELEKQGRFAYDVIPVKAWQSVTKLRNLVVRELHKINLPVLLVQSRRDESVHPRSAYYLQKKITRSELLELIASGHIATMGGEKDKLAQAMATFLLTTA